MNLTRVQAANEQTASVPPSAGMATAVPVTIRQEAARYAIYYAPPRDSAWWRFGCAWLGRDPVANEPVAHPLLDLYDEAEVARVTATPRLYGFHATLKPPFRLSPGTSPHQLYMQAAHLAASLVPIELPAMQLAEIGDFVALRFADGETCGACHLIAAQCVACFDNLRARPDAVELARRQAPGLTPRQRSLLAGWGYPYVLDEFRFHFTLSGPLPRAQRRCLIDALTPVVARLRSERLMLDALAVYQQPASGAPFVVTRRYGFDGSMEIYRDEY